MPRPLEKAQPGHTDDDELEKLCAKVIFFYLSSAFLLVCRPPVFILNKSGSCRVPPKNLFLFSLLEASGVDVVVVVV